MVFLSQKVDGNMIITDYWKVLVLIFSGRGNTVFLLQKVDEKMIFTDYWKVLALHFLVMGNMVFFSVKKLMERWYLLGLFELSMIFEDLGNMIFHAVCFGLNTVKDTSVLQNLWLLFCIHKVGSSRPEFLFVQLLR